MLIILSSFSFGGTTFFDHFTDGDYTVKGWTQTDPIVTESGTIIYCSDDSAGSLMQNFTNVSWWDEDWIFGYSAKGGDINQYTRTWLQSDVASTNSVLLGQLVI